MSQKENKKKYLEEYRVTLRIFESVFYKSLIRACSFDNFLAASQNARSYGQTINHRALRICKKRIQKVLMLSPFILINISSHVLSDSYNETLFKSPHSVYVIRYWFRLRKLFEYYKKGYLSETVGTRLHLVSGWSLDHSGA